MKKYFSIIFLVFAVSFAHAQIPRLINVQGLLHSGNTVVADGEYSVVLSLYESPNSLTPIYSETQKVNSVSGLFSVNLGAVTPIPASLTFDSAYFIGIAIEGKREQSPRAPFTSAPYALHTSLADGLTENAVIPKDLFSYAANPGGIAGGDLRGNFPAPTVAELRSQLVTNEPPSLYDRLLWKNDQWSLYHMPKPRTFLVRGDTNLQLAVNLSSIVNFVTDTSKMFYEDSNFLSISKSTFTAPDTGAYMFTAVMEVNSSVSDSSQFAAFKTGISVNGKFLNPITLVKMMYHHMLTLEFTTTIKLFRQDFVRLILEKVSGNGIFTLKSAEFGGMKIY